METPKNENPNKPNEIIVNDQNFQRVGEMKSEPTGLVSSPKNYDLYQDTESGALMGELPENHRVKRQVRENKEKQERLDDFDLMQLTPLKVCSLLTSEFENQKSWEVRNENLEIYGKINNGYEKELSVFHWLGSNGGGDGIFSDQYFVFYKDDTEVVIEGMKSARRGRPGIYNHNSNHDFTPTLERCPNVEITPNNIKIIGKSSLLIGGKKSSSVELSFLDVPKVYTKLIEKKKASE